jgi:hypothetical protein
VPEWLSLSVLKDVLLTIVALYGAGLSTFNYFQSRQKDRRQVRVSTAMATPTDGAFTGEMYAKFEAVNAGHRPVTITHIALELPQNKRVFSQGEGMPGLKDTPLPATLSDGQAARMTMPLYFIAQALMSNGYTGKTRITPICIDSLNNVYRGGPSDVDAEWLLR